MTLSVCAFRSYHHCRLLNLRISVSLLKLNPEEMNHVQTKATVGTKHERSKPVKAKSTIGYIPAPEPTASHRLLPPSVNSPRFNIILPTAS